MQSSSSKTVATCIAKLSTSSATLHMLILLIAGGMLLAALFFQYAMALEPCVMCVYQRMGVVGVLLGSLWLLFGGSGRVHIIGGNILLGTSLWYTINSAMEHVKSQSNSNPFFSSCEGTPSFPLGMPLDQWAPWLFKANGPCGDIDWSFLGASMPTWVMYISGALIALWAVALMLEINLRLLGRLH